MNVLALVFLLVGGGPPQAVSDPAVPSKGRSPAEERPRVGLVLSGGAAKGIAHVGALRVLEAAGVSVDVVTGTSMGAVVGGLYAAGYTPDRLSAIAQERDWVRLFMHEPERRALPLEDQLTEQGALASLTIEDRTVRLPSGLLSGQGVFEFLARLTWPYHAVQDFRELPRAFAAVAVELETGEAVRLDGGYLPLAMRASLSLPSLFDPVQIGGRTLIDGGIVRNLPAEDAQALGADVLICVDVSAQDAAAGPPSFLDVIAQTAFYVSGRSAAVQRARCDLLIEPDVEGLSPFAFEEAPAWIARGEAAAREAFPALLALADSLATFAEGAPGVARVPPPPLEVAPRHVVAVDVVGLAGPTERLVRRRLGLEPPATLTADVVEAAVERVYALRAFRTVRYRLLPIEGGRPGAPPSSAGGGGPSGGYVLVVEPEEQATDRLHVGFRYDTDNKAALYGSLSLRHRLRYGSTTQLSVRLGEETQLEAGYRARLWSGPFAGVDVSAVGGGQVQFTRLPLRLSRGGTAAAQRADLAADLDVYRARVLLGRTFQERVLVGAFGGVEHARAEPEVGPDSVGTYAETFASVTALVLADTRDRTGFPSRGLKLGVRGEAAGGALGGPAFQHLSADAEGLLPLGAGVSLYARAALTQGYGDELPLHYVTFVGGVEVLPLLPGRMLPLYGTDPQALAGRAAQLGAAGVQWARPGNRFVRLVMNVGRVGEDWALDREAFRTGFGLTLGTRTPVGPVRLTLSNDDLRDAPHATLSFGYVF